MSLPKIPIKSPEEILAMRESCQITAEVLDAVTDIIRPGISTEEINSFAHRMIVDRGGIPSCLNYKGFPKSICTSINDVICHGIPSPLELLRAGDIINVDVTTYKNGFHGDASRMYLVGGTESCSKQAIQLVLDTQEALMIGISTVKPGSRVGDIGAAIQRFIKQTDRGYGIVREYTGHGIGREFHEAPQVLHLGKMGTGERLAPGMTFTIEPMINIGTPRTSLSRVDGWTVRTADSKLSAQWEHTVLVTETGVEVLTLSPRFGSVAIPIN